MLCAKFGWNWLSGSGEENLKNFVNDFLLFRNYLPLEIGVALHVNKLCAKFGWNWPSGFREEDEIVKSLQADRQMTGYQKSSLVLSAQVS